MNVLFTLIVWELTLGGGGRVFALGPLPMRMVFFASAVILWTMLAIREPLRSSNERLALQLVVLFFGAHIAGTIQGVFAGVKTGTLLGEIQPLLYWLMAPFIAMNLAQLDIVERTSRIIIKGGFLVSIATVLIVIGILVGVIPAGTFYRIASASGEVFFRGATLFFYKGFFYVAIAAVFTIALRPRWWGASALLMIATVTVSLTRGLVLAILIGVLVVLIAQRRWRTLGAGTGLLLILFLALALTGKISLTTLTEMGDRLDSVTQRIHDTLFVMRQMNTTTFIFGEGIGTLINQRSNVENSYMWALWKLGVFGLAFWLLPLALSVWYFLRIPFVSPHYDLAAAYFSGVLMLYAVTATNPFINNPIGLSYLMIAMFSLRSLAVAAAASRPVK